jgi:hypothetical protein
VLRMLTRHDTPKHYVKNDMTCVNMTQS